jgi:CubicO group peptidase (beta-lactamase class C family)
MRGFRLRVIWFVALLTFCYAPSTPPVAAPSRLRAGLARIPSGVALRAAAKGSSTALNTGAQAAAGKPSLEGLDAFVAQTMKDWKLPGLAVAVVQDGKVLLSKGYGVRDIDKILPVTPHTLFAIGSITKSFTVTTLGTLVDEGKLDWDKPVCDYLPSFRLYDSYASSHVTPRDLVTHRTGLPRHDLVWYSSDFTRKDLVYRLRFLEPSKELRSTFQYNNLMFMTAGYMAGELAGSVWEEAVRQRILHPLGMHDTNFSVLDSQKSSDFARPYKNAKDEIKEVPFHNIDQIAPAGSINSSLADMTQYLLLHMVKGRVGEKRILSENNALQMQTPQMVVQAAPQYKELGNSSYGMGFSITTYRGHKLVQHGGAIDGFTANLAFLPQDGIGLVVLANLDADKDPVPTIVAYNIFDRLLGLDLAPWNQRYLEQEKKGKESEEEAKKKGYTPRKTGTHPSHDLTDYTGAYQSPGYGTITIALEGEGFKMTLNKLSSPLRHFHYDVFEFPENPLDPLEKMKVMFFTDVKGDISSLSIPLEPNVKEIVFTRIAERQMFERSFLEPLTGQYELPGTTLTIALKGDKTLVAILPGQPERELIPVRGTTFDLQGLSGFSIEFKKDASGRVTEAVIYQPGATFVVKKK